MIDPVITLRGIPRHIAHGCPGLTRKISHECLVKLGVVRRTALFAKVFLWQNILLRECVHCLLSKDKLSKEIEVCFIELYVSHLLY